MNNHQVCMTFHKTLRKEMTSVPAKILYNLIYGMKDAEYEVLMTLMLHENQFVIWPFILEKIDGSNMEKAFILTLGLLSDEEKKLLEQRCTEVLRV